MKEYKETSAEKLFITLCLTMPVGHALDLLGMLVYQGDKTWYEILLSVVVGIFTFMGGWIIATHLINHTRKGKK